MVMYKRREAEQQRRYAEDPEYRAEVQRKSKERLDAWRKAEAEAVRREAEKEQRWKAVMEQSRAAFKERREKQEKVITHGRVAFIRSLDPELSKEQTRSERELGKEWKEQNWSEAWQLERAAEAARPKLEPGLERDSGWRGR